MMTKTNGTVAKLVQALSVATEDSRPSDEDNRRLPLQRMMSLQCYLKTEQAVHVMKDTRLATLVEARNLFLPVTIFAL